MQWPRCRLDGSVVKSIVSAADFAAMPEGLAEYCLVPAKWPGPGYGGSGCGLRSSMCSGLSLPSLAIALLEWI